MRKTYISLIICFMLIFGMVVSVSANYQDYQDAIAHIMNQDYDLEGRTITIAGWPGIPEWEEEPELIQRKERVEEEFNCKINFIQRRSIEVRDELPAGVMAGDPEADIYVTWEWVYNEYLLPGGFLYPVGEILGDEYYENLPPVFSIMEKVAEYQGQKYAFSGGFDPMGYGMFWNKRIFEEEGLPDLYDIIADGEWTWEKMKEIAIQTTRDTTGDGEIDQWGLGGLDARTDVEKFLYTNNADYVIYDEDGKGKFGLTEPNALEVFEFCYDLIAVEKVTYERDANEFRQGNLALLFTFYHVASDNMDVMDPDEWGLAHAPKGPQATEYINVTGTTWPAMLPITVDNPEALLAVYLSLYPLEERAVEIEKDWLNRLPSVESYEIWQEMQDSWVRWNTYGIRDLIANPINQILAGLKTPSTAMEEVRDRAQAYIDEFLDQ